MAAALASARLLQGQSCEAQYNAIVCENQLPGNPSSEWDISGSGDINLQGFATDISVNKGERVRFKVNTTASTFQIDIYRLGYYNGLGARMVATIPGIPGRDQANCLTVSATGLVDCGNWLESASWEVPANAVSGIYIAKLSRSGGGASHIVFIVRDDAAQADLLFQTSDTTWQAYNSYGGNSLYVGGPGTTPARAYKVSYNRPFITRNGATAADWLFNAEYPMLRWIEANGFNVSYFTGVDTDRYGSTELLRHRAFLSVGHDEYWSAKQRSNVEKARGAGVHLAFFSGNEVFWKTRWESSVDGSNTPYRTLVSYKETHANAKIDPLTNVWTGTWRDKRFSPPADGGKPENALTGTLFSVNCCTTGAAIKVPQTYSSQPLWRNTRVATLPTGGTATLAAGTLGYEWDENINNGSRPAGLTALSSTTLSVTQKLTDNGSTYAAGSATHVMTLYRHTSGALAFGAGTVQWSWGLDGNHDRGGSTPDVAMQQATVNLFSDMGVFPLTLQPGLMPGAPPVDTTKPTSSITAPANGASFQSGSTVTITGTASDSGGGQVSVVNVSTNGGTTWQAATGTTSWSFVWVPGTTGSVNIKSRATDGSGNVEVPSAGRTVTITPGTCPCSIWNASATPARIETSDPNALEVGVRFSAEVNGSISGIRFYKGAGNTGPHIGNLWTNTGSLLASATFSNETASGWQKVNFSVPVAVTAGTTYVASYHMNAGQYGITDSYFATTGVDNVPLHAPATGVSGANGVYGYGASAFPTQTYQGGNYWVDVLFAPSGGGDTTAPTVAISSPSAGATVSGAAVQVQATASDNVGAVGVQFKLDGALLGAETTVSPYTVAWNSTTASNGSHALTAVARDAAGNTTTSAPISVTVSNVPPPDTTPPAVAISAPAGGAMVSGTVNVTATASDNVGVVGVQFKLEGANLGAEDMASPYATTWDSTAVANGNYTLTAVARDAAGNTTTSSPVSVSVNNVAPGACPCTIWNASATPARIETSDSAAVEIGVRFRADVNGTITGLRYYKGPGNTGTHVAGLWTNAGVLLATATFSGESTTGWQQVTFSSPVAVTANTTYVASYHTNTGNYAVSDSFFADGGVDNAPLHALQNGVSGANGVYRYSGTSTFPTDTYQSANYWVDIVFTPAGTP